MIRIITLQLIFAFLAFHAEAQSIQLALGAGYSPILSPSQYDYSAPLNVAVRYVTKDARLTFATSATYQKLSGHRFSPLDVLPATEIRTDTKVWTGSLGLKWSILQASYGPHLALDLLFSSIGSTQSSSGTLWFVPPGLPRHHVQTGMSLATGFTFPCLLGTTLDLDARYAAHGIFGGSVGYESINAIQFLASLGIPIWSQHSPQ